MYDDDANLISGEEEATEEMYDNDTILISSGEEEVTEDMYDKDGILISGKEAHVFSRIRNSQKKETNYIAQPQEQAHQKTCRSNDQTTCSNNEQNTCTISSCLLWWLRGERTHFWYSFRAGSHQDQKETQCQGLDNQVQNC